MPPEDIAALRAVRFGQAGIDQYINYIGKVLKGDFGTSWLSGYNVYQEFLRRLPNTIALGTLAMMFAVLLGIPLGIVAAIRQNSIVDYLSLALAVILFHYPPFGLASFRNCSFVCALVGCRLRRRHV